MFELKSKWVSDQKNLHNFSSNIIENLNYLLCHWHCNILYNLAEKLEGSLFWNLKL